MKKRGRESFAGTVFFNIRSARLFWGDRGGEGGGEGGRESFGGGRMPVVGHHTIRNDAHRLKGQRFEHHAFKRLIIFSFFKECLSTDRAVEYVVHHCTDDRALAFGMPIGYPRRRAMSKKTPDPFFLSAIRRPLFLHQLRAAGLASPDSPCGSGTLVLGCFACRGAQQLFLPTCHDRAERTRFLLERARCRWHGVSIEAH